MSSDAIQTRLARYADEFRFERLTSETVQTAKARVVDTLGALLCGYFAEPCRLARKLAMRQPLATGATVIGTRFKTTPELAAFANATTARYVEMTDAYHWGHPSDVIMPLLAIAERQRSNGTDLITAIVLGYEIYQLIADILPNKEFDNVNFCCLGSAVGAGKLLGLSRQQMAHGIAMAVVPNLVLRQVRLGQQSMFKTLATGYAGRAGIFAAQLAKAGMEGPHMPFEGQGGWCAHVARKPISLDNVALGGDSVPFRILKTRTKMRSSVGTTISSVLAAEKISPLRDVGGVRSIVVETYKRAKATVGTGRHVWHPESRETADHSIPYVVAATLIDGTVTPRSFDGAHLGDPRLRGLMAMTEVVENEAFTRANEMTPPRYPTRITVTMNDGRLIVGESVEDKGEVHAQFTADQISDKFRAFARDLLGRERVNSMLDRLWRLEIMRDVAEIPPAFVLG